MSQKSNALGDILNEDENVNNDSQNKDKKHIANEKLNQNSKSNSNKDELNTKKASKNIKHNNHKGKSVSKSKLNNNKSDLPWSCTLGLNNIAELDSLEMIYHLKNRNDALSLVLNKSLNNLVKAKGHKGMQEYNLNKKLFLMKHKDRAKHHYWKFYTSRKYRKN